MFAQRIPTRVSVAGTAVIAGQEQSFFILIVLIFCPLIYMCNKGSIFVFFIISFIEELDLSLFLFSPFFLKCLTWAGFPPPQFHLPEPNKNKHDCGQCKVWLR